MGMDNQLRLSSESDAYMLAQAPPLTEGRRRGKGEWQEWIMGIGEKTTAYNGTTLEKYKSKIEGRKGVTYAFPKSLTKLVDEEDK